MSLGDAIIAVLRDAGEPLHYVKITNLILERGLRQTEDPKYWDQVNRLMSLEIKNLGSASRFVRTSKGIYGLNPNPTDKADPGPRDDLPGMKPDDPALNLTDEAELNRREDLFLEERVSLLEKRCDRLATELKEVRELTVLALSTLSAGLNDQEERWRSS